MSRIHRTPTFLPHDLILEILSWLDVKTLMQLRCICKSWKTLISDPTFIQMHLKKSSQKPHILLNTIDDRIVSVPITTFLNSPSQPYFLGVSGFLAENCRLSWHVVGSCNGLLCIAIIAGSLQWLQFVNLATRKRSHIFHFSNFPGCFPYEFTFGCDNSTGDFKVVAFEIKENQDSYESRVKVFCLGDKISSSSRYIEPFPLNLIPLRGRDKYENYGMRVHFRGTINWLAKTSSLSRLIANQYVILSLDLATEKYTQLLMPKGFDEIQTSMSFVPTVTVLMDSLCFSHDLEKTHLVIWQMKEFGVGDSWTKLLKISTEYFFDQCYSYMIHGRLKLVPMYLSENGDTLLLVNTEDCGDFAYVYNCRDNTVKESSFLMALEHVESLVSVYSV